MFIEKNIDELAENFVNDIANEWFLISAGNEQDYNMMTASYGFIGEMWQKRSFIIAVRPQRYTNKFIEENELFTASFYGMDAKKSIHSVCGSKSGKDVDKTKLCSLKPVFKDGTVWFDNARLVLVCKKRYVSQLVENKLDEAAKSEYNGDTHIMYIAEIVKCYVNE